MATKTRVFDLLAERGLTSDRDIAEFLGLSQSYVWRIRNGDSGISSYFIEKAIHALPDKSFLDLFFYVKDNPETDGPGIEDYEVADVTNETATARRA